MSPRRFQPERRPESPQGMPGFEVGDSPRPDRDPVAEGVTGSTDPSHAVADVDLSHTPGTPPLDDVLHAVSRLFTERDSPGSIASTDDEPDEDDMRLAAYLRVSTEKQADDDRYGLDRQRHNVERFVSRADGEHEIVAECVDIGSGALGIDERDAFADVLVRLERGEIDGIVVDDVTRLARKLTVQEALLAMVWDRGGVVVTSEGFVVQEDDPDDPMRTAMRQMAGVFAQLNRAILVKQMRDGRKAKARRMAENGERYAWSHAPWGWRKEGSRLVPDEGSDARGVIEHMVSMQAAGLSLRAIAHRLNDDGHTTPEGGAWSAVQVQRVLARERAA